MPITAGPSRRVVLAAVALVAVLAVTVVVVIARNRPSTGDPGRLTEEVVRRPESVPLPVLVDATATWGLDRLEIEPAADAMAGGLAIVDIDGDGRQDLVIANGDVVIASWRGDQFVPLLRLPKLEAIAVSSADVDRDGWVDLLVATATDTDHVVWGGPALAEGNPEITDLAAPGQSSGLLAGDFGDDRIDIVRLGRGMAQPAPDIIWAPQPGGPRSFEATALPWPERFSLAGELVDADGDGFLDVWITRDVGWDAGGDSVLSRQTAPAATRSDDGSWVDIADELGVALEVDGMGLTIADLNGDDELDAYVSDLGDNELLLGNPTGPGFAPVYGTGAAHIRPVGAGRDVVSSTWGSGAIDINLDGLLDLVLASGGFPSMTIRNKIEGTDVVEAEPPAVLLSLGDGGFSDVWAELGLDHQLVARGMALGDLDGDGDDDIVIADRSGAVLALRNDTETPTVSVRADPACPGVSASLAGAVLSVAGTDARFHRLLAPHGYASAHQVGASVGVRIGETVAVNVQWPDGRGFETEITSAGGRQTIVVPCQP